MDSGSQMTYVSSRLRESLQLPTKRTESLHIKTFGSTEGQDATCEAVDLGLITRDGEALKMTTLVVPFICNPLVSKPINYARDHYDHLLGIELADSADIGDVLEVDMLIGSDLYWSLVNGGEVGPWLFTQRLGGSFQDQLIGRRSQSISHSLLHTH